MALGLKMRSFSPRNANAMRGCRPLLPRVPDNHKPSPPPPNLHIPVPNFDRAPIRCPQREIISTGPTGCRRLLDRHHLARHVIVAAKSTLALAGTIVISTERRDPVTHDVGPGPIDPAAVPPVPYQAHRVQGRERAREGPERAQPIVADPQVAEARQLQLGRSVQSRDLIHGQVEIAQPPHRTQHVQLDLFVRGRTGPAGYIERTQTGRIDHERIERVGMERHGGDVATAKRQAVCALQQREQCRPEVVNLAAVEREFTGTARLCHRGKGRVGKCHILQSANTLVAPATMMRHGTAVHTAYHR
uniref:Uncharacterized protein n=1 Tax=Anopheles coluzzii TaxID=1518534 RepID=A0A8W7PSA8_ANOCL